MKTKKCGAYAALAAVLLISAVLITSCPESFNLSGLTVPQGKDQTPFVPPEGMGYVTLNFGEGRTIRPATGDFVANVTAFNHFDVSFTADGGGTGTTVVVDDVSYTTLTTTGYTLTAGLYTVEVWAFNVAHPSPAAAHKDKAVAYGVSAPLTVTASGTGAATIALKEITTAAHSGTGTFKLNLTNASVTPATAVSLTIAPYPNGSAIVSGVAVTGLLTSYEKDDLDPGYYRVSLALSRTGTKSVTIPEILHIYQNMTSTYTATLPNLSPNVYDTSFTYNDGRTTDPVVTGTVIHGNKITEPAKPTHSTAPLVYDFDAWYTDDGTWADEWDFDDYPIDDVDLFAHWVSGVTVSLSYIPEGAHAPAFTMTDGTNPVATGTSFDRADPPTITITINNAGNYDSFKWYVDGIEQAGETGSSIELDFGAIDFLLVGERTISAEARYTVGGVNSGESASVKFTITKL